MSKKLMIVESPAKAKTIGKYLGGDFTVMSSVGHVRDLPKKGLSIKIEPVEGTENRWTFTPRYEVSAEKKKVVDELRKAARAADEVFLAPDPDREGEAIAWHLSQVLEDVTKGKPVRRVTYNEITKGAVRAAVENPGEIDLARVDAQQARRILDRLVGFKVSPLLWKNLQYGYSLSAGRVQSAALRLLVEREREIAAFNPVAYWVLGVEASKGTKETAFIAKLARLECYRDHEAVRDDRHVAAVSHHDAFAELEFIFIAVEKHGCRRASETEINGADIFYRGLDGGSRLRRVSGANDGHARARAHDGEVLKTLMRRSVLADGYAAVSRAELDVEVRISDRVPDLFERASREEHRER